MTPQPLDTLKVQPIRAWEWPRPVVFVPLFPALPYAEQVFFSFIAIAQQGVPFLQIPYGRTDLVRNIAVKALLESDYTHILMLDADHKHPADIVQRLARWVLADRSIQIVGGLNFRRIAPYDPCAFIKTPNGNGKEYSYPHEWDQGLLEVDLIGTGCVLIAREVFKAMEPPWFYYPYKDAAEDNYPTDDVGFSRNCQAAGIKMYVDTTTTSPHMMSTAIDEQTFRSYWQANPEAEEGEKVTI